MSDRGVLIPLEEAFAVAGGLLRGVGDVAELGGDRPRLVAAYEAVVVLRRAVDAVQAGLAAEIARQSRPEFGAGSLAKEQGFRSAGALIAATAGTSHVAANRMIAVGEATRARSTFDGAPAAAVLPAVADACSAGVLGTDVAALVVEMVRRVGARADRDAVAGAERELAARLPGLTFEQAVRLVARVEAALVPDELEVAEGERRAKRSLRIFERDGMVHLDGVFDVVTAAPIKTAIDAIVAAGFRRPDPGRPARADVDADADVDVDERTVVQRHADALHQLAVHALGCDAPGVPVEDTTVIVRIGLAELRSGAGVAEIDGIAQPISVSAARKLAASARVIPCVLGADGDVLDWGREKRLFTRTQRLALVERDGGCAMCGLEPAKTKAHHIRWWHRDTGPTDLTNGVLLCEACHHRIHDNGWEVTVHGTGRTGQVWFTPPPHIDPHQHPRPGGRRRYDPIAA